MNSLIQCLATACVLVALSFIPTPSTRASHAEFPESAKLKKGEVVRMFKTGGHTPYGIYRMLIVVRTDGKVAVKGNTWSREFRMDDKQKKELRRGLDAIDHKKLTAKKNPSGIGPSAADGIDLFVSYCKVGKVFDWDNVRYIHPGPIELFDTLDKFQTFATPKEPQ